jgi:hypothetical protein
VPAAFIDALLAPFIHALPTALVYALLPARFEPVLTALLEALLPTFFAALLTAILETLPTALFNALALPFLATLLQRRLARGAFGFADEHGDAGVGFAFGSGASIDNRLGDRRLALGCSGGSDLVLHHAQLTRDLLPHAIRKTVEGAAELLVEIHDLKWHYAGAGPCASSPFRV